MTRNGYSSKQRKSQMNSLMRRFDATCWWCKTPVVRAPTGDYRHRPDLATRDHWKPHSLGGKYLAINLVLACRDCNDQRGDLTVGAWMLELRARGLEHDWHKLPPLELGHPQHVRSKK